MNKNYTPKADERAIVKGDKYRFTVLTDRMIRIEYNENGIFEDRATQVVINRLFDVPEFSVFEDDEKVKITTNIIELTYYKGREFSSNSIFAVMKYAKVIFGSDWYYGKAQKANLGGTVRTLDEIDGETELEMGIANRCEFSELDDSKSLIIEADGKVTTRNEKSVDLYLMAYTDDYYGLLRDFYKLSGPQPLLPRFAMGNMWSRYYKYTQSEYLELMDRFKMEDCPFSVAVIDMDWHIVDCPPEYGKGWTGYTWNKELFPDYKAFLAELHKRGMEITLNLHPADGVAPYEDMYEEMAQAMSVTDNSRVEFDITDDKFMKNYFEILHHPYENDGVSFWWLDWQQGNNTRVENLDPLWMLNYYHCDDMIKRGKRPVILSRYAGIGSHRYPIGFSGDSIMTWESLDFQPYFTVNASNVGYGWWSHDIGGHMKGIRDDELTARWVQFGVFSPINRLHSSNHPLLGKEPWNYNEQSQKTIKNFLRLRHELVPYIYTMNYRAHTEGKPLMIPMYYEYPQDEKFYDKKYRNEYFFGSEMMVSPITQKINPTVEMAAVNTYIPDGIWFDFFNGRCYFGNREMKLYRGIYDYPVLVKAGAIIPMSADGIKNDVSNPQKLKIRVFAGADNEFELYEDDGRSYGSTACAFTKMELKHGINPEFVIYESRGDKSVIPQGRSFEVEFNGYSKCDSFTVSEGGTEKEFTVKNNSIFIENVTDTIKIKFNTPVEIVNNDTVHEATEFLRRYQGDNALKQALYEMLCDGKSAFEILMYMNYVDVDSDIRDALTEILTAK